MSTPATLPANLREARMEAIGLFTDMARSSMFIGTGIARQMPADAGFLKLVGISAPGRMTKKSSIPGPTNAVSGLDSRSREVAGETFYKTLQIDNDLAMRSDAIARGEISRLIREQALIVGGEIDRQLTELMLANGAWLGGSALFSSTNGPIPGTSITFDNLESSAGATAANNKTNYHKARKFFATLQNSMGYAANDPANKQPLVLMYPADIEEGVDDAFELPTPGAAIGTQNRMNRVRPVLNPYLTDSVDNYYFNVNGSGAAFAVGVTRPPEVKIWEDPDNDCWKFKILFGAAFAAWNPQLAFMCT